MRILNSTNDGANISRIHSHLYIKNLKSIHGELTELMQIYCLSQNMLYILVWQSHVKKTVIEIRNEDGLTAEPEDKFSLVHPSPRLFTFPYLHMSHYY